MAPGVVVVSGLPAAGKSTLSERLAADLDWAWVCRDRLGAEVLAQLTEVVPEPDRDRLGSAKDRLVSAVAGAVLDAGGGLVLDGNFNRPEHAAAARALLVTRPVRAVEICLWGDTEVLRARFLARPSSPALVGYAAPYFERVLHRDRWSVLAPPAPVFELDTTDLHAFDRAYPALLAAVRSALDDAGQRLRGACPECGFDWEAGPEQLRHELRTLAPGVGACLTRFLEDEDPDTVLRVRPAPDVWSALEYAAHLRDVSAFYGERMRQIAEHDRPVLVTSAPFAERSSDQRDRDADLDQVLTALVQEADAASQLLGGLDQFDWWRLGVGSDGDRTLVSLARRLAHESHHHQLDLGRVLRAVRGR